MRKAFLVGINTHGLQYAAHDAALMSEALQGYGYEIVRAKGTKREIVERFEKMLDACKHTDTVIVYFSGHGVVERGMLQFILDENNAPFSSKLNLNELVQTFERCKIIRHKLVILDCCNAGSSRAHWNSDFLDKYYILSATGPIEKAKELDELRAGFLTHRLHAFLTEPPARFFHYDNKIRIVDLYQWLKREAEKHNFQENAIEVSIPNLFGNLKANFELGEVALAQSNGAREVSMDETSPAVPTPKPLRRRWLAVVGLMMVLGVAGYVGINRLFTPPTPALLQQGRQCLQQGQTDAADALFSQFHRQHPDSPAGYYWQARVAVARDNPPVALAYLARALQRDARYRPAITLKVRLLLLAGGENRARAFTREVYGHDRVLDTWLDCLEQAGFFSAIITTASELERACPESE